jgi:ribosomal protein L24E
MARKKGDRCPWCDKIVKPGTGQPKVDATGTRFLFHKTCLKEHQKFLQDPCLN